MVSNQGTMTRKGIMNHLYSPGRILFVSEKDEGSPDSIMKRKQCESQYTLIIYFYTI